MNSNTNKKGNGWGWMGLYSPAGDRRGVTTNKLH